MTHNRIRWDVPDIGQEEIENVTLAINARSVGSNGPMVKALETAFAEKVGAKHALAVSNGTSALLTALYAMRHLLGPIRVGVPSFTFIASANTAAEVGESITLIDCDMGTWNITSDRVPDDIDVLMTVDVGGLPCDYDAFKELDLPIIADSAESVGAMYKGQPVGAQANVHCFSLHRAKIITAGEGGMVTTGDTDLYNLMRRIANHGYAEDRDHWSYRHDIRAFNFRMTDLAAAVAWEQLGKLDRYVEERRHKATIYREVLGDLCTYQQDDVGHPYFFFGALIDRDPDWFCAEMYERGIDVKTWTAVHKQPLYSHLPGYFPHADFISEHVVLLPIGNTLDERDIECVAEVARELLSDA
jgi:perosamine synthetase